MFQRMRVRFFVGYLVAFSYVLPLGILLSEVGDKPVNFVLSDLAWAFVPVLALLGFSFSRRAFHYWGGFFYFLILGMFGAIELGGELGPIFSSLSFFISTIHLMVGALLYRRRGGETLEMLAITFSAVGLVLLLSDLIWGSFPRGCGYEGRWGGCFLGLEVYGFPNSSATFMVLSLPLILYALKTVSEYWKKIVLAIGILSIVILTPLSLSRTAFVTLIGVLLFYLVFMRPVAMAVLFPVIVVGWFFLGDDILSLAIFEGIVQKTQVAMEYGDVSTGRFDIWSEALRAFAQAPIFGHKFQYFSSFSEYGTAHQQYLEILFKSGLVGALLYFGFFFYVVNLFFRTSYYRCHGNRKFVRALVWAFILPLLLSCFFQPTLSYQLMANIVFMISGFVLMMSREKVPA